MSERNQQFDEEQQLQFSGEQGFFDKSKTIQSIILFFFALSLFTFLHFREVRVEILDLNTIAPSYVVSQVDFDFPDEEATIILKQESVRNLGKIYRLPENEIRQRRLTLDNFLLYNQGWREQAESRTFDALYLASEAIEKALLQMRFTDEATFKKLQEMHLPTSNYQVLAFKPYSGPISLPSSVWNTLQESNRSQENNSALTIVPLVIDFFKTGQWDLEEDISAERKLSRRIQEQIPDKLTHVPAGNRIIDQGEKVTSRHVAMLQAMKNEMNNRRHLFDPLTILGSLLLTFLLVGLCLAYFKANIPRLLTSNRKLFLLVTVIAITLGLSKLTEFILLSSTSHLIDAVRYPLFIPLTAILLCSLLNPAVATFISGFLAVVLSMTLAFDREGFLIANLAAALVAILTTHSLRRRKEIFIVCLKAFLCSVLVILAMHLYNNTFWSLTVLADILSAGIFLLLTAVLVVGLLPLLESAFSIMTDVTLMEYMDPNNDLLRRLTLEAPGTYQHSVVVGNLAEAAALAIGANGLFCRVATLYHDIGKMVISQYFTENQIGEVNIHQLLTPQESAQVIMSHVPEGVSIARAASLPEPIIDIIKEHHGTTLVYYFYCKQVDKAGGDKSKVDEREFRYAGPKPRSKESGIIMIADSFEAASRSLDKVNSTTLTELVDRIVRYKFDDGQFDQCLLTFEDLNIVKKMLVKTLLAAGHSRIKYPSAERNIVPLLIEESA